MFEIGLISIVVLAVGYWVTLWLMGRHDDVLHGDFVQSEQAGEATATSAFPTSRFPPKPVGAHQTADRQIAAHQAAKNPLPAPLGPRLDQSDTLQSLLASIKRDLKDASQL